MSFDVVLGASGFIGDSLVSELARRGRRVVAVGRNFRNAAQSPQVEQRSIEGLYRLDHVALVDLLSGAETLYHLAWSTVPATAEQNPLLDLGENVGFFIKLLAAADAAGVKVVFCSSGGTVYGATTVDRITEDHPCRPISSYGAAKLAAESYGRAMQYTRGADVRIARIANPFGPGQHPEKPQGAIPRFYKNALAGAPIEVWGDGSVVRDYLYVSEVADCLARLGAARREDLGGDPVFNIGSGHGYSLVEVIEVLQRALDREVTVLFRPSRALDVPRNVLDSTRAAAILGWKPSISLEQGIRLMWSASQASQASHPSPIMSGATETAAR